jgi:hypothetical protein
MRALVYTAPHTMELQDLPRPVAFEKMTKSPGATLKMVLVVS